MPRLDILFAIVVFVALLVMALSLFRGKGAWLIGGLKRIPEKKRAKIDVKGLCRFMGKVMLVLAGDIMLLVTAEMLELKWLTNAGLIICVVAMVWSIIWTNYRYFGPVRKR